MDGSTCAILFLHAGGNKKNIYMTNPDHRETSELVLKLNETHEGHILIADVSISLSAARKIKRNDIWLFDHHRSALELSDIDWCHIEEDNQMCGSMIFYKFLAANIQEEKKSSILKYHRLVQLADDRDRWIKNYKESDKLAALHNVLTQKYFIERFEKDPSTDLTEQEKFLLELEEKKTEDYIQQKKSETRVVMKKIDGKYRRIGFVQSDRHQSLLGSRLCEDLILDLDFVVMIGSKSLSLRASKMSSIDLSRIAKLHGGGGHQKASGVPVGNILNKPILEQVIENMKFE